MPRIEANSPSVTPGACSFLRLQRPGYGIAPLFLRDILPAVRIQTSDTVFYLPGQRHLIPDSPCEELRRLCVLSLAMGLASGITFPRSFHDYPYYNHGHGEKKPSRSLIQPFRQHLAVPFIALFFLNFFDWRQIFNVFGGVSFLVYRFTLPSRSCKQPSLRAGPRSSFRRRSLWIIALLWIIASGYNLGVYFFFPFPDLGMHLDSVYATSYRLTLGSGWFSWHSRQALSLTVQHKKNDADPGPIVGFMSFPTYTTAVLEISLFLQAAMGFGFFPVGLVHHIVNIPGRAAQPGDGLPHHLGVVFGLGIFRTFSA